LAAYRLIIAAGPRVVAAGGYFLVEGGEGQAIEIADLFLSAGLQPGAPFKDLAGIDRVVPAKH
jgi:methylase of polypeptide subunit release factors